MRLMLRSLRPHYRASGSKVGRVRDIGVSSSPAKQANARFTSTTITLPRFL
jgi:hypothetical protein|tara:strand:- start:5822 stop:5974 length:153 start_codon:yes stop_codon:yes gene_type:complete